MKKLLGLIICLMFFASPAGALDIGIGAKVGTAGPGIDLSVGLTRTIAVRLSLTDFDIDDEEETVTVGDGGAEGDIDAELGLDFGSNALLLDWYVFNGSFHLTAGMMRHNGGMDFSGTLLSDIVVDGQALAANDIVGEIGGEIDLADSYQPYLGIGWGRKAGDGIGLSITVDVGVVLLDPSADFTATVNPGGDNTLSQAELDQRLRDLEDDAETDLDSFEAWPIVSLGLNFRF